MFTIHPKDICPCGSGIEYRKCHTPNRDKSDDNIWKGPGYLQNIYFGHKEPLTGIWFDKASKGEFKLLKDDDRVPVARFFCVDDTILACKAFVRFLSVSTENGNIRYTGSLEIQGDVQHAIPVLIGCIDLNQVVSFDANLAGIPVSNERGNWGLFIGEDDNPMARIRKQPQWFRYFVTSGFLVKSDFPGEINFCLVTKSREFNLFTLALPFGEIEIPHPQISVPNNQAICQLEIEKENVSWDLVLHQEIFTEKKRARKDSKQVLAYKRGDEFVFDDFDKSTRKHFSNPRKLRIGISIPELSGTISKFAEVLERTIRTISEDGGFNFDEKGKRVLESDFRDYVLTVLKSMGHFAVAEPSRRGGFIDILLQKGDSEAIIEFKIWGRRKYKEVIEQVLGYGTSWTTEYATVMINPNEDSIVSKFIEHTKKSPGYKHISEEDIVFKPINKLISCHYLPSWDKHITVSHFIINAQMLRAQNRMTTTI